MSRLLCLALFVASAAAQAAVVQPTSPIYEGDLIVGFETEDPNLYYIVPQRWQLHDGKAFLERTSDQGDYALYFILGPDYSHAKRRMADILNRNPKAVLLPLPQNITEGFLDVPSTAGTVVHQLVPDNLQYFQSLLYYRLALTQAQLEQLTLLAQSATFLPGRVKYSFPYQSGTYSNVSEIHLNLRPSDLVEQPRGAEYPYLWIKTMLTDHTATMRGVIDGPYSLGGSVNLTFSNSVLVARVDTAASVFSADAKRIYLRAGVGANLDAHLTFHIEELGRDAMLDITARLDMSLDSDEVEVKIDALTIIKVTSPDGSVSSFYQRYLTTLLNRPDVRARIEAQLTIELQERILNQSLFLN